MLSYIVVQIYFRVQGNITGIQLEKATKIATSLNVTNPPLASNYCTIDSTGVNIATGLSYEINGVEYLATKKTTDLLGGTNLYYSLARLNANLATKTTDDLNQGITNKYLNAFTIADTTEINHKFTYIIF